MTIKSDAIKVADILRGPEDRISHIRAEATKRLQAEDPRYFCAKCGHPVFLRYSPQRVPHFYHQKDANPDCEWYSGDTQRPDHVDARKYDGVQEGPLHKKLKQDIIDLTEPDERFQWVQPEKRITDDDSGKYKRPDIVASFKEHRIVFELQLATTHNQVIVDREEFYRKNGMFIVWVFYSFERFKQNVTAKDVYHRNHGNAIEIDDECVEVSKSTGKLHLKIHWREPVIVNGNLDYEWKYKTTDLDDLVWDTETGKPYFSHMEEKRLHALRQHHTDLIENFEQNWLNDRDTYTHWKGQAEPDFEKFSEILSIKPAISWEQALDRRFDRVVDTLFTIKTGDNPYTSQDMVGSVDTALNNWKYATDIIIAALKAFDRTEILDRASIKKKILKNQEEAQSKVEKSIQRDEYNPIVQFIFPEMAPYLPWYG